MAVTPTFSGSPSILDVTLSGTPNTLMQVNLPTPIGRFLVSVQARDTDAYLCVSGTDGGAAGSTSRVILPKGVLLKLENCNRGAIFLGSSTGSQVLAVVLESA